MATSGSKAREALTLLGRGIQFFGLLHVTHEYGFDFCTTVGGSMEPAFSKSGDVLLYDKFSKYFFPTPDRGQVVVLTKPDSPGVRVCKRVVGIGGDFVRCEVPVDELGGCSTVVQLSDGREVVLEGENHRVTRRLVEKVPKGHVWVQGDNKPLSLDSRHYGAVPIGLIEGRVRFRLWPLSFSRSPYVGKEESGDRVK